MKSQPEPTIIKTMSEVTIYHNPHCSKSRATLALLEEHGVTPDVVEYLSTPPDAATLKRLLDLLGLPPRELMRRKETAYSDLGLDDDTLSDDALIEAMIANPMLIERPIVVAGQKAVVGRPPKNVLTLV